MQNKWIKFASNRWDIPSPSQNHQRMSFWLLNISVCTNFLRSDMWMHLNVLPENGPNARNFNTMRIGSTHKNKNRRFKLVMDLLLAIFMGFEFCLSGEIFFENDQMKLIYATVFSKCIFFSVKIFILITIIAINHWSVVVWIAVSRFLFFLFS